MSRLLHLTAILLSLVLSGQGLVSLGGEWICNATGAPMRGCPCTSGHGESGTHASGPDLSEGACCEQVVPSSDAPVHVASATSEERGFAKVVVPTAMPWPLPASQGPVELRVRTAEVPTFTARPRYLTLRQLLI